MRSLEKYHPGYKDRKLSWAKIFLDMAGGDPDLELITDEIDWSRFVKLILLELRSQKPLPNDPVFWARKGFDLKRRPMSLTLQMLHSFVEVRNESVTEALPRVDNIKKIREYKEYKEYKEEEEREGFAFDVIWTMYPQKSRVGKKAAVRHFEASVKTDQDFEDIQTAVKNYLLTEPVKKGFVKNGATFFNNWRDYLTITPMDEVDKWRK